MPKLTKTFIDNVTPPESGYKIHWDEHDPNSPKFVPVKGYGLRVTSVVTKSDGTNVGGRKTFVVQGRVRNKSDQQALMEWSSITHGGAQVREPVPKPMTAQQEREFEHQVHASRSSGLTKEQRAARAYAKAMGLNR